MTDPIDLQDNPLDVPKAAPGHGRKAAMQPVQWLKTGWGGLRRLAQTAVVVAQAGVRHQSQPELGKARLLRESFEQLGATYIKLGQFIASTPSLFAREYVEEFQGCLDRTPPVPFAHIEAQLRQAFDRPLAEIFAHIDPDPLASASIAQVHAARLVTGEEVVIKVQKPGIEAMLRTDLGVVHGSLKLMELLLPKVRFAALSDIMDEIRTRMVREVDFVEEAANIADFQQFLKLTGNTQVIAPKVYPEASSRTVLTMQRLYGVALTDVEVMKKHTRDPAHVLIVTMNTWFASLMLCKSFHADLHAGNVLLLEDGRIGFIDFGIVGQLKPEVWAACIAFMDALQRMDYPLMATQMVRMGMTTGAVDEARLAADLEKIFGTMMSTDPQAMLGAAQGGLNAMAGGDLGELNDLMLDMVATGERHGIHFPRDFALLMKQMLYFDRFMRVLTPDMDVFADARLQLLNDPEPLSRLIH